MNARFDKVIANAWVIDPETKLDAVRHAGINGGAIGAVSDAPLVGNKVSDATCLVAIPCHIDLHSQTQSFPDDGIQALTV